MTEIDRRIPPTAMTASSANMAEFVSSCLSWKRSACMRYWSWIPTTAEVDAYVFEHKTFIMYGPVLFLSYSAIWSYYDRSDVRRFATANTVTIEHEALGM